MPISVLFSKHRESSDKVWSSPEEEEERCRHRASSGMNREEGEASGEDLFTHPLNLIGKLAFTEVGF